MKCAAHPDVETNLTCSKCGKPICPRCLVQTPVGARCPQCARLDKLPTYSMTRVYYLRAISAALGTAIFCGIIWALISVQLPFLYFNFLLAAGVGYAIAEVMSLSVNRKRGVPLAIIAGIAVIMSYLISVGRTWGLPWGLPFPMFMPGLLFDLLALAFGIFVAVNRLR
ncbi:MAG: hypothetical protein HYX81_01465 [Chloroflexi bacterium]|nr:hypothetical protein [Chloroflexota bacterium]